MVRSMLRLIMLGIVFFVPYVWGADPDEDQGRPLVHFSIADIVRAGTNMRYCDPKSEAELFLIDWRPLKDKYLVDAQLIKLIQKYASMVCCCSFETQRDNIIKATELLHYIICKEEYRLKLIANNDQNKFNLLLIAFSVCMADKEIIEQIWPTINEILNKYHAALQSNMDFDEKNTIFQQAIIYKTHPTLVQWYYSYLYTQQEQIDLCRNISMITPLSSYNEEAEKLYGQCLELPGQSFPGLPQDTIRPPNDSPSHLPTNLVTQTRNVSFCAKNKKTIWVAGITVITVLGIITAKKLHDRYKYLRKQEERESREHRRRKFGP